MNAMLVATSPEGWCAQFGAKPMTDTKQEHVYVAICSYVCSIWYISKKEVGGLIELSH